MNASRAAAVGVALAALGCCGGCSGPRPDPWGQAGQGREQGIAVEVVRRPVRVATGADGRPSAQEVRRVVAELEGFAGGNLGALHLYLPGATTGAAVLAETLVPLGVNPRKMRTTLPPAGRHGFTAVAERFVAHAPACPPIDLAGAAFGPNEPRAGLRCAGLANLAAQVSDPADLLLNGAVAPPDPERATSPVARYRGTLPSSSPPQSPSSP